MSRTTLSMYWEESGIKSDQNLGVVIYLLVELKDGAEKQYQLLNFTLLLVLVFYGLVFTRYLDVDDFRCANISGRLLNSRR